MPYIPARHEIYDLLPYCRKHGGEVFSYSKTDEIDNLLPDDIHIIPYGYDNYEEYFAQLNEHIANYGMDNGELNQLGRMLAGYIEDIKRTSNAET